MRALAWLLARVGGDEPREAALAAEIRAELEHHLACTRAELERAGLSPAAAAAEAERRFGARARVEAECVRIRNGERSMGTKLHALLTAGLLLAVLALTVTLQRSYRTLEAEHEAVRVALLESARAKSAQTSAHSAGLEQRVRALLQRIETLEELEPAQLTPEEEALLGALGYVLREPATAPAEQGDSRAALEQRLREYLSSQAAGEQLFRFDGEGVTSIENDEDLARLDEQALRELAGHLERILQERTRLWQESLRAGDAKNAPR